MAATFSVLTRNRDFRRLFGAELVVFGSDWFVIVPLLVLLPGLTGSGVWGGLVLAVDTGINALLLPFAGTVADRFDRRRILMGANLGALVGVLLLFAVRSADTAPLALVAVGAMAVAKAFYSPAASAALPNVVDIDDLPAANAIAGSSWGTMTIVGASLGGIVGSAFGPYASFAVTALCLLTGALLTMTIRRPLQAPRTDDTPVPQTRRALVEVLRYINAHPRIRALVTVKTAAGLGNGVLTVFPLIAGMYGVGVLGAGLLFAVRGAGALVGPFVLRPVLNHRSWLLPGLALSMSLYGLGYLGVAVAPWFPLVLALVFVAHLAGGANWTLSNFALQGEVPDRLRGRVFATDMMLATLAIATSQLGAAAVVDHVDERAILAGCGLLTLTYAIGWRLATRRLSLPGEEAGAATVEAPPDGLRSADGDRSVDERRPAEEFGSAGGDRSAGGWSVDGVRSAGGDRSAGGWSVDGVRSADGVRSGEGRSDGDGSAGGAANEWRSAHQVRPADGLSDGDGSAGGRWSAGGGRSAEGWRSDREERPADEGDLAGEGR